MEIKEMKEQMTELVTILRHSESRRRETEKQLKQREQAAVTATTSPVWFLWAHSNYPSVEKNVEWWKDYLNI